MQDYALQLLVKMLRTYSPSGHENEISNLLVQEMEGIGFTVSRDEVGNVIGEAGVEPPSVMLCGHMDTVPGLIPVRIEHGNIYARGAVDAKASLATMIAASSELIRSGCHGRILLVAVVDEEGAGKGIRNIIKRDISTDHAIFGEPSGVGNVIIGYKGSLRLKVTCETETGHVAAPWLFENAIETAFKAWKEIAGIHFPEEDLQSRFYSTTSCLTGIEGGNEFGKVPSKCAFGANIRIPPQVTVEEFVARARECMKQFRKEHRGTNVTIELEDSEESFEAEKSSPLVRSFTWAIKKVTSRPAVLLRKTGTGDINAFAAATRRPMVAYGPGDSHLDHTDDEHVSMSEYLQAVQVCREALNRLLRTSSGSISRT